MSAALLPPALGTPPASSQGAGSPPSPAGSTAGDFASALFAELVAGALGAPALAGPTETPEEAPARALADSDPDAAAAPPDAVAALLLAALAMPVAAPPALHEPVSAAAGESPASAAPLARLPSASEAAAPACDRADVAAAAPAGSVVEASERGVVSTPSVLAPLAGGDAGAAVGGVPRDAAAPSADAGATSPASAGAALAEAAPSSAAQREPADVAPGSIGPARRVATPRLAMSPRTQDADASSYRGGRAADPETRSASPAVAHGVERGVVAHPAPNDAPESERDSDAASGGRPTESAVARPAEASPPVAAGPAPVALLSRSSQGAPHAPPPVPVESVPTHVEWLAARGGGSARLRLDPPHLGPIDVSVTVRGERVEVVFTTHEAATPDLVHAQREALGASLAARDLRLDHFEVRGAAGADAPSGRALDGDLARQGGNAPYPEPQQTPERRPEPRGAAAGASRGPAVPAFDVARGALGPRERRIDLRV